MKRLSLIMATMVGMWLPVTAQRYQAHTTAPGQLADKLAEYGDYPMYVLFVDGPINASDFMAMRDYCYGHELWQIDLSRTKIEGNTVPSEAFYDSSRNGSTSLQSIVLPEEVTEIGDRAFYNNTDLCHVCIPNNIEKIGDEAFACTRSYVAYLPAKSVDLGDGVFSNSSIIDVSLPEGIKEIPPHFADGATTLMKIRVPESVERIGARAFALCQNLGYIKLPEGVREIGRGAFAGCASITDIDLPSTLTYLQAYSLIVSKVDVRYMICRAEVPPVCEIIMESSTQTDPNYAITPFFDGGETGLCVNPDTPVYIPSGTIEAYRQAPGWGYFRNLIETDSFENAGVADVTAAPGMRIYSQGCSIVVESPVAGNVTVTSIDGRTQTREVTEGTNVLGDFTPGFYIVNTTKLYLR